jgi:dipeptidyl aminopeptidase/acylaminoacyl peptidase
MKRFIQVTVLIVAAVVLNAQTTYKLPPKEVVDILDAPPTPMVGVSPRGDALFLAEYPSQPPISLISRPFLRLGGVRIDPQKNSRQRLTQYTGVLVKWYESGKTVRIELPPSAKIGMPQWSNDGKKLAFTRDVDHGVELWVADAATGKAKAIPNIHVNDVLVMPFDWTRDNVSLLACLIPAGPHVPPEQPRVPLGPIVEETAGKVARAATFQDLLKSPFDEELFEFYGTSQLALVNTQTGEVKIIGTPSIVSSVSYSPDEKYILVTQIKKPFSYRVPYSEFARTTQVWDANGSLARTIADLGVSDDVPSQGVPTGPRNFEWQPLFDSRVIWVEALDGGDPMKKVPFRDAVMSVDVSTKSEPKELLKVQFRFGGIGWTGKPNQMILTEIDRDRRWRTSTLVDLSIPAARKVLFDLSINDAYTDPGRPVYETRSDGGRVIIRDGDWMYLAGNGASDKGDKPFIDKFNLTSLKKERLYTSGENSLDRFVSFVKNSRSSAIVRCESKTAVPNYFITELKTNVRKPLTDFKDPAPQLTGMKKELVKYSRPDGVALSGTLYLPPGYVQGNRLPVLLWAYPMEYSDAGTAGQVRGSANGFTFFRGASPLFFVTQGYAVLMDATMPVVGDAETMNNTFVEQIVAAAKAAIDKLDSMGVADRKRVVVSGHSYGAFMTANLLAHSDLFAAGIARSGAYNRTLTPFGFQSERRSFWEAPDLYMKVSPFTYADKIKKPLLLIHGEADNNSGTHPIQSERLFQAIKGNGGTARYVVLPFESHGYSARESVLHVLAEMFEWADKYAKNN